MVRKEMHEVSLAHNIVDSIHDHVEKHRIPFVRNVITEIGVASGVVSDSLRFAFEAIVRDTPLRHATLDTVIVPFKVRCAACGGESENETGFMICGICDSTDVGILSGTELTLKQIELIDE